MAYKSIHLKNVYNPIIKRVYKTRLNRRAKELLFRQNLNYLSFRPKIEKCT